LVNIGAFDRVHIYSTQEEGIPTNSNCDTLIIAKAGCMTGDIIIKAIAAGVTVPLGSCLSVGAGL
jgi:hypothetical protein